MPQFLRNKRLIILLAGIIILVALIGFSLRDREELSWPEQFVKDTVGFVQNIFAKPAHYVAGFVENVHDLLNTYEENKVLKQHLDEYAKLRVEADRLQKENEEYRDLLDKEETLASYHIRHASVISRNPDRWNESLIIDKGEVHNIEKDMAVITADGMIGKIKSVGKTTSSVQLLSTIDRTNRVHVAIQGVEDTYGLVEGIDEETQLLLVNEIPAEMKIEEGMNVITSGFSGIFPEGLFIGTVEKVEPSQYGLTQTAYVKPAANFYNIKNVMVIERAMPTEEDHNTESSTEEGEDGADTGDES
ncbi:rod shape-determining protein MreC [Pallidibacillus pasinlerensis]|uniref:Cell shape-determining protein MreC n=1 Tax=Pallidibacillus pasinlerensis TaxID=2703818 RepID=A0ABX0A332_9BACI|nr:rod shape-determining protein MreC [Pallidibacillus pasinlerensis]NCU16929.1 rod shape-determining protein MreC [Pallidibacillus pasinlerensis]